MKFFKLIFFLCMCLSINSHSAPLIDSLNIQGFLRKGDGTVVADGSYSLIIGVLQNNSVIWAKSYSSVSINKGVFSQTLSGAGSNLISLSASTGMNSDYSLINLSPSLLQNAATGAIKFRIYASSPIDLLNPQFDVVVQSVPSAFVSQVSQSVANNSIVIGSLANSVYTQTSSASKLVQLNSSGKIDPSLYGNDIPSANLTGTIPSARFSLVASDIPNLDAAKINSGILSTSRIDVGTAANKILQLDSTAKIPAVNGSLLTNLSMTQISGVLPVSKGGTGVSVIPANKLLLGNSTGDGVVGVSCNLNEILKWNGTQWTCAAMVGGGAGISQVTGTAPIIVTDGSSAPDVSLNYGSGLTVSAGSLVVDSGISANKILQLDANAKIPAVDGSQVTQLDANHLATGTVDASLLPEAGAAAAGIINTSAQTIAGDKTLSGNTVFTGSALINGTATLSGKIVKSGITSSTGTSFIDGSALSSASAVVILKAVTAITLRCIETGINGQTLDVLFIATANGVNSTINNNGTCTAPAAKIFTNTGGNVATSAVHANLKAAVRFIYLDAATSGITGGGWFLMASAL